MTKVSSKRSDDLGRRRASVGCSLEFERMLIRDLMNYNDLDSI